MAETAPRGDVWVVLPSLNPSDNFDRVVDGVLQSGFAHLLIVDDGSRPDCKAHFRRAAEFPQCTVLTHEVNRGKGAALKTAFAYLTQHCPDAFGAVTIDGDGQHLTRDILRCVEALDESDTIVMGCRDFSGPDVPARSAMGNRITSAVFRLLCGIRLSDTQTGLRALPAALFRRLLNVRGERFEYETNMLIYMQDHKIPYSEIDGFPVSTVPGHDGTLIFCEIKGKKVVIMNGTSAASTPTNFQRFLSELNAPMTVSVQWMERTLDDSANRRVSLPEGFLCADAVLRIVQKVTADIFVNTDVINKTVMTYLPFIATENLMMEGVKRGGNRQELHEIIRRCSMEAIAGMDKGESCNLLSMLADDENFPLTESEMTDVLDPSAYIGRCPAQVQAIVDKTRPLITDINRENAEINI